MDYDENMNAMVNAAGAEAIKPAEIGQGTHERIVHDLGERIGRLEIDAREAYARGRREAIEEAAEWLVDRARSLEDECDEECDGQDADRFLDLAKSYRETSKAMLAELNAKGPARGQ